jgi:outer membrane immunogenic protein
VLDPKNYSDTAVNREKTAVGFSAGLGVDYALSRNVFVRGEFEYLQFGTIGPINVNAIGVRTGLGMKF